MVDTVPTLPRLFARTVRAHPDHDCVVLPGVRASYREVDEAAVDVARSLVALGVRPGDAVGVLMPNCLDFVHVMLGISMTGALFVPVNARLAPREIAHVVVDSAMRVLVTTDVVDEHVDYVARLHQALPELTAGERGRTPDLAAAPGLRHVVVMGERSASGLVDRRGFLAAGREIDPDHVRETARAVTADVGYIMMYTSGTTAEPRGCPLSHESVIRLGRALGTEAFGLTADDRMWNPLPMFHVSAQAPMIAVFDAGAAWISMTHFEPDLALDLVERERATLLYPAYPTLTAPLLGHPSYGPDTFRRVRAMLTVGPPELLRSYQEQLPHTVHVSCYGSTETGGVAIMGRLDDPLEERLTSGKPFAGVEAQVRDVVTDEAAPAGETGVLYIRGFNLFSGYRNDPRKTAASFDRDGWFGTGDLASIDTAGNLTFRGRTKDMLKVGGENVGALEVESYLTTHPDIQLAGVVGIPDARYGEVPAAFVELRPGASLTAEDVLDFCRRGLARYKVPRHVRFVTEWPMSATKIQKFRLRDQLLAELGPTGDGGPTRRSAPSPA
ncbi:AMP-dependent synthetase [Actinomycetospora sp. NBRC 106375]|uniref:AMP-binding protein n=1 Tax=Actinomycetospora sp. NBRC 106375 TaxID=3032207 RepID=UPI0024A11450|nr:AMP-binding protein [Actinomycetospora sp. NBRC 106375]GLZ50186.1 AMP-dependent synthetase [Actinomycetospora sp. NBRC 106375]